METYREPSTLWQVQRMEDGSQQERGQEIPSSEEIP